MRDQQKREKEKEQTSGQWRKVAGDEWIVDQCWSANKKKEKVQMQQQDDIDHTDKWLLLSIRSERN